jgi:hypothetical protein
MTISDPQYSQSSILAPVAVAASQEEQGSTHVLMLLKTERFICLQNTLAKSKQIVVRIEKRKFLLSPRLDF